MIRIFISFASRSRELGECLKAVLTSYGGSPFVYTSQVETTLVEGSGFDKIRTHCSEADLFIQILDGSAGTYLEGHGATILELELAWYLEGTKTKTEKKTEPLILSRAPKTSGDERTRFDAYFRHLESDRHLPYYPWSTDPQLLQLATHWFVANRVASASDPMLRGYLDAAVANPPIDRAIRDVLKGVSAGMVLPQKFLYTSPFGLMHWRRLTENTAKSVRTLYDTFDYSDTESDYIKRILAHISSTPRPESPLSVIALGCGDGRREAQLAYSVARVFPQRQFRMLLVDVSKTMLSIAAKTVNREFQHHSKKIGVEYAIADFEHDETLAHIIHEWSYEHPCIVLFLGNTLGNIDVHQFLDSIGASMKPKDLLIAEVVLASDEDHAEYLKRRPEDAKKGDDADHAGETGWLPVSPQQPDDRFDFIYNPIRSLGIEPNPKQFKVKTRYSSLAVSRVFAYDFFETAGECSKLAHLVGIGKPRQVETLPLMRVDAFFEDGIKKALSTNFTILERKVYRRESRWLRNGRKVEMGVILASKI